MSDTTREAAAEEAEVGQGWLHAMGARILEAGPSQVVVEMSVDGRHLQPMGIVHGGVYCGLVETVCSVGAYQSASLKGMLVVGVDNSTSFLKAVREGVLTTTGTPITQGRKTELWRAEVRNAAGRLVASGQVRLLCLNPGDPLAGKGASGPGHKDHPDAS